MKLSLELDFQNAEIVSLEVQRDLDFNVLAVEVILKVPIVWMTGRYAWDRARIMKLIPYSAKGNFNIDLIDVTVGVIAVLKTPPSTDSGCSNMTATAASDVPSPSQLPCDHQRRRERRGTVEAAAWLVPEELSQQCVGRQ